MKLYYSAEQIARAIEQVAEKINASYDDVSNDSSVVVVAVLKGAAFFFADLTRKLTFPLEFDFIRASSYGNERFSSGEIRLTKDVELSLEGRRVLIVEDVVDSGRTLDALRRLFLSRGASEVRIVVLLNKETKRAIDVPIDFCALKTDNRYLVGYGLDDGEKGRNLPDIWVVEPPK